MVAPPGQARSDAEVVFELAKHLGLAEKFWDGDIDAAYRQQLAPTGVTIEQLRAAPRGIRVTLRTRDAKHSEPNANGAPRGFATPSRKIELYSQTLLDHGYLALPDFEDRPSGAAGLGGPFPVDPHRRQTNAVPEVELDPAAAQTLLSPTATG